MDRERLSVEMGLHGTEPIGRGDEKEVFEHRDPKKVVKVTVDDDVNKFEKGNERYIKAEFYLTKILHLLFPENIPDIHQVSFAHQASVHEKKEVDSVHAVIQDYYLNLSQQPTSEKVLEARSILNERKVNMSLIKRLQSLGIMFDRAPQNFAEDPKGLTVFLDSILPWEPAHMYAQGLPFKRYFNIEQLRGIITEFLEGPDQTQALKYLVRLEILANDEEKRHNSLPEKSTN